MSRVTKRGTDDRSVAELQSLVAKKERITGLLISAILCSLALVVLFWLVPLPAPGASATDMPAWITWVNDVLGITPSRSVEIRAAIGGGLLTFALFSIGLEFFDRRDRTKEQANSVFTAVVDNDAIIDELSNDAKRALVTKSLKGILPDAIGEAVGKDVVLPLVEDDTPYRRQYKYRVSAISQTQAPTAGDLLSKDLFPAERYRWMRERIQYQRYFPEENRVYAGSYQIYLAFNKGTLDTLFKRQKVFFRAMVELDNAELGVLFQMLTESEEKLKDFILRDLQLEVRDGGLSGNVVGAEEMKFAVEHVATNVTDEPAQPVIAITVPQSTQEREDKRLPGISLRFPYLRSATHFTFTLPQPCENPTFEFFPSEDMERVEGIYYMSMISDDRIDIVRDKENGVLKSERIAVEGWVFPTSGVTYTWSNIS